MPLKTARRTTALLGAVGLIAILMLTGCAGGQRSAAGRVVWGDYGGPTRDAFTSVYFENFTKDTGIDVIGTTMSGAQLNKMLQGGKGDYDTLMVGPEQAVRYRDNLLELPASVPRSDLVSDALRPYAIGTFFLGYAQGYLDKSFPDGGPKTWADFWNVEKFPGKRAVPGNFFDFMLEAALIADGVAPQNLYPLDFDRAFAKLNELKPHMVFYTEYPQIQQLLSSGTASIAFGPSGSFAHLAKEGQAVTVSWDQAFVEPNYWVATKQANNPDQVFKLAAYLADPEKQAKFAEITSYGPGDSKAFGFMDKQLADSLPNSPSHTDYFESNPEGRAEMYDQADLRYAEWLSK